MEFDKMRFFTDEDNQSLIYFKLPKVLMVAEKYAKMSNDAKLLYAYYLDLNTRSMRNRWKDNQGRYYVKFRDEKAMAFVHCAKQKLSKLKKELREYGLIYTKRNGQGKTDTIYVLKLEYTEADVYMVEEVFQDVADDADETDRRAEVRKSNFSTESKAEGEMKNQKYENQTSKSMKIKPQEVRKSNPITKNNSIKNTFKENDYKSSSSRNEVKDIHETTVNETVYVENNEEEENLALVNYKLKYLGEKIAEKRLMPNNNQIQETLRLVIERKLLFFDFEDIDKAVSHYILHCVKTQIVNPPLFFVNGLEMKLNQRFTYGLGEEVRKEQQRQLDLQAKVKKVQFYNWLEDRS